MYIKIEKQKSKQTIIGLVEYLEKEAKEKDKKLVDHLKITLKDKDTPLSDSFSLDPLMDNDKEYFFSSHKQRVSRFEIIEAFNFKASKKQENDFFMMIISPSQDELNHLYHLYKDPSIALKEYTRDLMRGYALCMSKEKQTGEPIKEQDLIWYGIYEYKRKFTYRDKEIKHNREYIKIEKQINKKDIDELTKIRYKEMGGLYIIDSKGAIFKKERSCIKKEDKIIKEGLLKRGRNDHIHVLIHKKDKSYKIDMSPLSNAKGDKMLLKYYLEGKLISRYKATQIAQKKNLPIASIKEIEIKKEPSKMGFNRYFFKLFAESAFDHKFDYKRDINASFWSYNQKKKDLKKYLAIKREIIKEQGQKIKQKLYLERKQFILSHMLKKGGQSIKNLSKKSLLYPIKEQLEIEDLNKYLSLHGLLPLLNYTYGINKHLFHTKIEPFKLAKYSIFKIG